MRRVLLILALAVGAFAQAPSYGPGPGGNGTITGSGSTGTPTKFTGPTAIGNAAATDLIGLWTGCSGIQYLGADGACHTAISSLAFSAITTGANTSAVMQNSTGSSLSPLNIGQVAGSQFWMQPGLVPAAVAISTTGGNLLSNHSITVRYTFVSAAGETTPSATSAAVVSSSCTGTNQCSVTVTAPTLPSGYTGYTVYANDATIDALFHKQTATNACVNITANCIITAVTAGAQPPTTNTAFAQPPNAQANNGPGGSVPSIFFPKVDGNYYPWLGIDITSCDVTTGPPLPCGTPTFTHRTYFNDLGGPSASYPAQQQTFKNAAVSISHGFGNGTVLTNQDRAMAIFSENAAGDTATHYSMTGLQIENDVLGNPNFSAGVDTEAVALSLQQSESTTAPNSSPAANTGIIRATYFKQNTGGDLTNGGKVSIFHGFFVNNSATAFPAGTRWVGYEYQPTALFANNTGLVQIGTLFNMNSARSGTQMIGIEATGGTLNPTSGSDFFIRQDIHNWNTLLNGNVGLNEIHMTDLATLPINASVTLTGALTTAQIASGWTNGYNAQCSGGASTYGYTFVAVDSNGGTSNSAAVGTPCTTGVNPLTSGNPVTLNPGAGVPYSTVFAQAVRIDVYRTSGPMATGKIGSLTCANDMPIFGCSSFVDTGLSASGSLPTTNSSGTIATAGPTISTASGPVSGSWQCTNVSPVTVSANVATDQTLMACTIPANTLNFVGKTLRVWLAGVYSTEVANASTIRIKVKLCTVSGCGSGTVITPINIVSGANLGGQTTDAFNVNAMSTTQTAGASAAFEAHGNLALDGITAATVDSVYADTNTATVGTIDATGQLFLQVTGTFSVAGAAAGNIFVQRQLVVDSVN